MLPEPSPNDDIADVEPPLSPSRDAGEKDFADAKIDGSLLKFIIY